MGGVALQKSDPVDLEFKNRQHKVRSSISGAIGPEASSGGKPIADDKHRRANKNLRVAFISTNFYQRNAPFAIGFISLLLGVLCWQLATFHNFNFVINFENVPSPLVVADSLINHLANPQIYIHILVSIKRVVIAFSLAAVLGVIIGVAIARSRHISAALTPYIELVRPIPAVAWIPMAILMWPTEESSIIYITFLGALFPIILNTRQGVEQTPGLLVRAARSLGASRFQVFLHVVLPSALPAISSGLAVGMGVSWFSLLAGEIISGQYGIGYFTWNAYSLIEYPNIVIGMLTIGGLGTLSTWLVKLALRPALRWQTRGHV